MFIYICCLVCNILFPFLTSNFSLNKSSEISLKRFWQRAYLWETGVETVRGCSGSPPSQQGPRLIYCMRKSSGRRVNKWDVTDWWDSQRANKRITWCRKQMGTAPPPSSFTHPWKHSNERNTERHTPASVGWSMGFWREICLTYPVK